MKIFQKIVAIFILLALISCGGGGGGGSSGPTPFSVRLDKSSISLTAAVGQTGVGDVVTAIASGTYSGQIYVGAVVEGVGIDPNSIGMTAQGANLYISLQVANGLSAGTYTGRVLFYACSDYYCTHPIGGTPLAVNYTVLIKPGLVVTPSSLTFSAIEGALTAAQTLAWDTTLVPASPQTSYTNGSGWLSVTATPSGASVTASAVGMTAGTYRAFVVVTPSYGSAISIPVTLTVGSGLIAPSDVAITVDTETTASGLQGAVPINAGGGVSAFSWSATSNAPWLVLTRASGLSATNLTYQVDATALQALPNFGSSTATVTVSSTGPAYSPVQFNVTLQKNLPEVTYIGPYVLANNKTTTLRLRGRGFNSLSNFNRVQIPGLIPSAVTRLDDTELTMQVTPTSAADYVVSIGNVLGFNTGSATIHVLAPQTYAYAAIPTNGLKRSIVWDPQRQSLYAVNLGTQALTRLHYSGSAWNQNDFMYPNIVDIGLGPDGSNLIATSSPGTVSLLDPTTMSSLFSLSVPGGILNGRGRVYWTQGISTSNNGRSWLGVGVSNSWDQLQYFDHRSRTLVTPSLTSYYNPWTAIARNGERMLLSQVGISPSTVLYSDAVNSILANNPGTQDATVDMQLSDDGSRVLFNQRVVRDANFNLIGNIALPVGATSYNISVAAAISPDGTRVYVLAYNSDAMDFATTTLVPTVYVFDSSTPAANLPLIGTFDLSDYPTCRSSGDYCIYARTAISPDGGTLFFAGDVNFVIAPIPTLLRAANISTSANKTSTSTMKSGLGTIAPMHPWNLKP